MVDILVFLPGEAEIIRACGIVARQIQDIGIFALYAGLGQALQQAVAPALDGILGVHQSDLSYLPYPVPTSPELVSCFLVQMTAILRLDRL